MEAQQSKTEIETEKEEKVSIVYRNNT